MTKNLSSEWDKDDISEYSASEYLKRKGYSYDWNYHFWTKPSPDHIVTNEEREAIWFLVGEWDYGGLDG